MTSTTTAPPASTPSDQEKRDAAAKRTDTIKKVIERSQELSERLDLITEAMASALPGVIAGHSLGEAVNSLSDLSMVKDAIDESLKAFKAKIDFAKEVTMPERLDTEEITTFNTDDYRMTRTARVFASIKAGMVDGAYAWLRNPTGADPSSPDFDERTSYDAIIKETVNSSALSAVAKEIMANGMELPEDLFGVVTKDGVSITKKKKG